MKNKTVRDAMLPLGDVFMIDADSAMDKPTMSKVAYICLFLFTCMLLYISLRKLSHLAFFFTMFTGKMFYIKAFVWYLYFVFKNKSRIYCATFYRKTFLGEGKWLPRILQTASFNLT